jgi:hypothetical protein
MRSRWWHGTAERRNWRKSEAWMSLAKYWIVSFFYESGVLELKKV